MSAKMATLLAGVPIVNQALYHRIRFAVGDSAAWIETVDEQGRAATTLLVRDIEMHRARQQVHVDCVACSADFAPTTGLSADRDTALAEAVVECLQRDGVERVVVDRSLPFLFAWHLQRAGLSVVYDSELGVLQRRSKDDEELSFLRAAQAVTEAAIRHACETVAQADADADGLLLHHDQPLTSENLRKSITRFLLEQDFSNTHDSIVATLPHSAECHHFGTGPLISGMPVIVDIFPRDNSTRYWGDCTRTVVHGTPTRHVQEMHAAVIDAKQAGLDAMRVGATAESVHAAVAAVLTGRGYQVGPPSEIEDRSLPHMPHGTGHGIGLEVHEPILLDRGGGVMLENEVFTVEPGLYSTTHGGVRIEDMVAVTREGVDNFNQLHEGLDWI